MTRRRSSFTRQPTYVAEYTYVNPVSQDKIQYGKHVLPYRLTPDQLLPIVIVMEPLKAKSWLQTISQLRRNDSCVLEKLEVAEDGSKLVKVLKVARAS